MGLVMAAVMGIGQMPMLAGLGFSRSSDAKDAANAAGAAANAAGCAENIENQNENPGTPSPYTPPAGFSCP